MAHQNLNPENVLFSNNNGAVLQGYGRDYIYDDSTKLKYRSFIAPEISQNKKGVAKEFDLVRYQRADIYSLGVLLCAFFNVNKKYSLH